MIRAGVISLVFLAAAGHVSRLQASDAWRYLQAFMALQDRVAHGDAKAYAAQGRMISYIGRQFAAMPDATWKDRLNAEALFVFLLSGGNPAVAERIAKAEKDIALPKDALSGAIAYGRGLNKLAWLHLQKVSGESLTLTARAQLSLAKASLRAAAQPAEALKYLDEARLLKPGTLLEEAALRRAIYLAGQEGEISRFKALSGAYIRRFRTSWYVSDFLRRFAWLVVRLDVEKRPYLTEQMAPLISRLSERQQALLHAAIARGALMLGKRKLALHEIGAADKPDLRNAKFSARLKLWKAAAQVVTPFPEKVMENLQGIDARLLEGRDRKLLVAVAVTGEAIMREPAGAPEKERTGGKAEDLPVIVRAKAMAAGLEKLLEEKRK